jgi:hypothetical protein
MYACLENMVITMIFIREIGLSVVRVFPWLLPLARSVYRHLPETWHDTPTSCLPSFFRGAPTVSFIQIGAFDGIARFFEKLRQNYKVHAGRLNFLNCAISSSGGERPSILRISKSMFQRFPLMSQK